MKKEKIIGLILYIFAISLNLILHIFVFFRFNFEANKTIYFICSFLAFNYMLCFIADFIYSILPSNLAKMTGKQKINNENYMNTIRNDIDYEKLPSVTISIPVYVEENTTIFETILESKKAIESYMKVTGKKANIVVSDDGLGILTGKKFFIEDIEELMKQYKNNRISLSDEKIQAAERIEFYRKNKIGFVIRPKENRAGLFKKASNLNYTLKLGEKLEKGKELQEILKNDRLYKRGYAEGDVITNDIILLLDKDSGLKTDIIQAIVPEFIYDKKLAYVHCATEVNNINDNFYSKITGHQINDLFQNIWPCQVFKGLFVPLGGHNVFIRKKALKKIGYWDENKVSEDYDAALKFYANGYHGKYAQIKGLEFTEYTSRTYTEETMKQYRYTYGLFEMIFEGSINYKKNRIYDIFFMLLYFSFRLTNVIMVPYILFLSFTKDLSILNFGFIFCLSVFTILPVIRSLITIKSVKREYRYSFIESIGVGLSFLGHGFSAFASIVRYFINKLTGSNKPFPSTSVSTLKYNFKEGLILMGKYINKNKGYLFIVAICLERIVEIISDINQSNITKIVYIFIFGGIIITPFVFTPHFYNIPENNKTNRKLINSNASVS